MLNPAGAPVSLETPIPEPGSAALDAFLSWLPELGLEMGGIGSWGPWLPSIRSPAAHAPSAQAIELSRAAYAERRMAWWQAWHPQEINAATDVERLEALEASFERTRQVRWQPSRLPAVCMEAAAAKRLGGLVMIVDDKPVSRYPTRDADIGASFGMGWREKTHLGVRYYQQVRPLVWRGDEYWSALGRWPWGAFDAALPEDWWHHGSALDALQAAHDQAGGGIDVAQRVAAAREVAAALTGAITGARRL